LVGCEFGKIDKSNAPTIPYISSFFSGPGNDYPVQVSYDFMEGFHFCYFERPWFVEVIETDGAPVD